MDLPARMSHARSLLAGTSAIQLDIAPKRIGLQHTGEVRKTLRRIHDDVDRHRREAIRRSPLDQKLRLFVNTWLAPVDPLLEPAVTFPGNRLFETMKLFVVDDELIRRP